MTVVIWLISIGALLCLVSVVVMGVYSWRIRSDLFDERRLRLIAELDGESAKRDAVAAKSEAAAADRMHSRLAEIDRRIADAGSTPRDVASALTAALRRDTVEK